MSERNNDSSFLGKVLLAGAAVWFFVLRGANAVKVVFESIAIKNIGVGEITLGISLLVRNPLLVDITIKDIVGDVYIMDVPCAKVDYPVNSKLYGVATNRFNINFKVNQAELSEALWENIQTGDVRTLLCRFVGYVEIGKIRIPLDRTFTFNEIMGER